MGRWAVQLVTRTINDLYYVVNVGDVTIPATSLVKGALLGVSATVLSAALPAWEAASVPPRPALTRSDMEDKARRAVPATALAGAAGMLAGGGVLAIPTRSVTAGFAGIFLVAIGFALLAPLATLGSMRLAGPATGRAFGVLGRMAPRSVTRNLSRTAVAIAALMLAVSVTLGVGLMVGSFRATVVDWLGQTLGGDIYISAPSLLATRPSAAARPERDRPGRRLARGEGRPRGALRKRALTVRADSHLRRIRARHHRQPHLRLRGCRPGGPGSGGQGGRRPGQRGARQPAQPAHAWRVHLACHGPRPA